MGRMVARLASAACQWNQSIGKSKAVRGGDRKEANVVKVWRGLPALPTESSADIEMIKSWYPRD
jgi:hypothetical protein